MRPRLTVVLCALLLGGCDGPSVPPAETAPPQRDQRMNERSHRERASPSVPRTNPAPIRHSGKSLDEWVHALASAEEDQSRAACEAAVRAMGRPAAKVLVDRLRTLERNSPTRDAAWDALSVLGDEAIEELVALLNDDSPLTRLDAVTLIDVVSKPGSFPVTPFVNRIAVEPDQRVRRALIATAAGYLNSGMLAPDARSEARELLARALSDGDARHRWAVARLLREMCDHAAVPDSSIAPDLARALTDPHAPVRREVALALGSLSGSESTIAAPLSGVLDDPDESVRLAAARALLRLGLDDTRALAVLVAALDTPNTERRAWVISAIGAAGSAATHVAPRILQATESSDARIRSASYQALARIGAFPLSALSLAERALQDASPQVRLAALDAAASTGEPAIPLLGAALSHGDASVRCRAAEQLSSLGTSSRSAVPSLIQAMDDDDDLVRFAATRAVVPFAHDEERVRIALIQVLADSPGSGEASEAERALVDLGAISVPALEQALWRQDAPNERALVVLRAIGGPATRVIAAAMRHPADSVRARATSVLLDGSVPTAESLELLRMALSDSAEEVRLAAVSVIERRDGLAFDFAAELRTALGDISLAIRVRAASALGNTGEVNAVIPVLVDGLHAAGGTKMVAARALLDLSPEPEAHAPTIANALAAALEEEATDTDRCAMIRFLAELGPSARPAVPALLRALQGKLPSLLSSIRASNVEAEAARALGRIGPAAADAVPALVDLLEGRASPEGSWTYKLECRVAAAEALGAMGKAGAAAIPALRDVERNSKSAELGAAARAAADRIASDERER